MSGMICDGMEWDRMRLEGRGGRGGRCAENRCRRRGRDVSEGDVSDGMGLEEGGI